MIPIVILNEVKNLFLLFRSQNPPLGHFTPSLICARGSFMLDYQIVKYSDGARFGYPSLCLNNCHSIR